MKKNLFLLIALFFQSNLIASAHLDRKHSLEPVDAKTKSEKIKWEDIKPFEMIDSFRIEVAQKHWESATLKSLTDAYRTYDKKSSENNAQNVAKWCLFCIQRYGKTRIRTIVNPAKKKWICRG